MLVAVFSLVAAAAMFYGLGFSAKKAAWVAGGAGAAMILFDVVIPMLRNKKKVQK